MRILHIENTAGVAYALSRGQRELGHQSDVVETFSNPMQFPHDMSLYYNGRPLNDLKNLGAVVGLSRGYDLIHVHAGVHWKRFDVLAMNRLLRKPIVVHYHGSETRLGYGLAYRRLWKYIVISRPDLFEQHPNARLMKNPVMGIDGLPIPRRMRVLHAFHNPDTKGSALISEALLELKDEGADFEFIILEKVSHDEVMREMATSSIVIDQVLDGKKAGLASIIGVASLEAMAMGRVAISSFDIQYRDHYHGCPVIAIEPSKESLKEQLRFLLDHPEITAKVAEEGPMYIRANHSPASVARDLMGVYEAALADPN